MKDTLVALLASRKFWTGTISLTAVFAAVLLRSLGLIPADALIPTIVAITTTALGFIGATAWEDVAASNAEGKANAPALPSPVTTNVTNVSQPTPPPAA